MNVSKTLFKIENMLKQRKNASNSVHSFRRYDAIDEQTGQTYNTSFCVGVKSKFKIYGIQSDEHAFRLLRQRLKVKQFFYQYICKLKTLQQILRNISLS